MTIPTIFGSGDRHLDKQVADVRTELAQLKTLNHFRGHDINVRKASMLEGYGGEPPREPNGYLLALKLPASLAGIRVFCGADGQAVVITRHMPARIGTWAQAITTLRQLSQYYRQISDTAE